MAGATTVGILSAMAVQGDIKKQRRIEERKVKIIMSKQRKPRIKMQRLKRFSIHFMIFNLGICTILFNPLFNRFKLCTLSSLTGCMYYLVDQQWHVYL